LERKKRSGILVADDLYMKKFFQLAAFIFILSSATFCQENSLKGGEFYSSNFLIDSIQRNFIYYLPVNYGKKDEYPLVIFLHGQNESSKTIIKNYGNKIQVLADSSDAIVIYPDAVAAHWNDKPGAGFPSTDKVNDVGFISILVDYFKQVYSCDSRRVYVAGFFNGGKLAYRLSCDIPAKITAVAPFISDMNEVTKCNSDKSVAIMNTHSLTDSTNRKVDAASIEEVWKFFMSKTKE